MSPAQPLLAENLAQAAPLDGNALHLGEEDHQAVERPGVKGLIQLCRRGQGNLQDSPYLMRGIDPWTSLSRPFLQSCDAQAITSADPAASRPFMNTSFLTNLYGKMALVGEQADLGAFHTACTELARGGHFAQLGLLLLS